MTHIDIHQAKERFLELIERAANGEEVIISKDERPLVRLAPMSPRKRQRLFGGARGLIALSADFNAPLVDFKEFT
jgi:prevent-host-death family protein